MNTAAHRGHLTTAWSAVNALGTTTEEVIAGLHRVLPSLSLPPPGTPFETVCGVVDANIPPFPMIQHARSARSAAVSTSAKGQLSPSSNARERDRVCWAPARARTATT